jgi:hypothetical protein
MAVLIQIKLRSLPLLIKMAIAAARRDSLIGRGL